jgi:glycosyltransferase involved in cell wall biosynthesis
MDMKKIKVVINEEFKGMNSGWPTRYVGLLRQLEKHFQLYLFAPGSTDKLKAAFPNCTVCDTTINDERLVKGGLADYLLSIVRPRPEKIYRPDFKYYDQFKSLLDSDQQAYDVSLYFGMSGFVIFSENDLTRNKICDFCDSRLRALKSKRISRQNLGMLSYIFESTYVKRIKRRLISNRVLGLAITDEDVQEISRAFKGAMLTIQNGIDEVREVDDEIIAAAHQSPEVLFLGSLDFDPNIDAVRALAEHIWVDYNKTAEGRLKLNIVGRSASDHIKSLVDGVPNAQLYSDVPSTTPYYDKARFFVVPIYFGAGMKNKVLEALARGTPVLTTEEAVKGIRFEDGVHGFIANSNQAFVEKLHYCESIPFEEYRALSLAAIELARSYQWDQTCRPLIDRIAAM